MTQTDQADARVEDLVSAQVQSGQPNFSTAQVPPLAKLSSVHWRTMELCHAPWHLAEILDAIGANNRGYLKEHDLDPLIQFGIAAMTNPENPRASNQGYEITEAGAQLKARRMCDDPDRSEVGYG